ncbi:MAG: tRNA pseudouridine synthase B, partial [bacterium]
LKHQGKRLYELAREGKEVVREPRDITIFSLEMVSFNLPDVVLDVHCSKGTYVRTLAEDIGAALCCGAHVAALTRTAVGEHGEDVMVTMDQLREVAEQGQEALDALLYPVDYAVSDWPAVNLDSNSTFYVKQGQAVQVPKAPTEGWVRIYDQDQRFMGLGEIDDNGRVAPRRLMANLG